MRQFLALHSPLLHGVLNGYDRMLFRGTLRFLSYLDGLSGFLSRRRMLHKDFLGWSESVTERIKRDVVRLSEATGRPVIYLNSSALSI